MFTFLPETALRLPGRAGTLRPGMDGRAARWAVATLADVREGWVCGAGWAFHALHEGLRIDVQGDVRDRRGPHRDVPGLASVEIGRLPGTATGPCHRPVVVEGVDVFGYPAAEVLDALGGALPAALRLRAEGGGAWFTAVRLDAVRPEERRPEEGRAPHGL